MSMPTDVLGPVSLRIGPEQRAHGSGGVHRHVNPSTGTVDVEVPLAGADDIHDAVICASEASRGWRRTPPCERRRLLLALADLIAERADDFAHRAALDTGTPVTLARRFVPMAAEWTRYYAGAADRIGGDLTSAMTDSGELAYTLAQPYGVIGAIVTWNAPLMSLSMKIPAVLAAGNAVVIKPSELTPFVPDLYADLTEAAGFPPGVINVLPGSVDAGAALVRNPLVGKITFTGGPQTATSILQACADLIKPVVLELGGKSANVVFADADLDAACSYGTFMSVAALSGQACSLPTRMLVEASVYPDVVNRVATIARSVVVGDPFDRATMSGPLISETALNRVAGLVGRATQQGAKLITGGARLGPPLDRGYFFEPTVLADVDAHSELAQTEVFGPVLAITPFEDEEEAVAIANATRYGLSAYVQTRDLKRAHRLAEALVAGEVLVNGATSLAPHRPFGGFGNSGIGKEGGRHGIEEFLRIKAVGIA